MKRCPLCKIPYEDNLDNCPVCGRHLQKVNSFDVDGSETEITNERKQRESLANNYAEKPQVVTDDSSEELDDFPQNHNLVSTPLIEERHGRRGVFRGEICNVQTELQKKESLFRSALGARPYPISGELRVTYFRLREDNLTRLATEEVPMVAYGVQNLHEGDAVEVEAKLRSGIWVVTNIRNMAFSSGSYEKQASLSGASLRGCLIVLLVILFLVLSLVFSPQGRAAIGLLFANAVAFVINLVVVIGVLVVFFRLWFPRRRR